MIMHRLLQSSHNSMKLYRLCFTLFIQQCFSIRCIPSKFNYQVLLRRNSTLFYFTTRNQREWLLKPRVLHKLYIQLKYKTVCGSHTTRSQFFFFFYCFVFQKVDISITPGTHASEDAGNTHFCSKLFSLFMLSSLVHAVLLQVSCMENETLLVII